ncbi:MAG: hypothetical protein U0572_15505 [Phycisphaerales bacterium]
MIRRTDLRSRLRRSRAIGAALLSAAFVAALVPACNIVAPASYALFGPGKVDGQHQLQPVRTVVFIDDRQNVLPRTSLRASIGEKASQDLLLQKQIPSAVDPKQAIAVTRQKEGGAKPMSIAAIGRELECQQVIYVQLDTFAITGDGEFTTGNTTSGAGITPTAKATVKVIDVVNNVRTFPAGDQGGFEITAKLREVDPDKLKKVSGRRAVEDQLAIELGQTIGELFYSHEAVDLGEHLGPRTQ